MNEFEEVENLLRSGVARREDLDKVVETVHAVRRARERKLLVYFVGWLYIASVGGTILYLILRSIWGQEDAFDNIFEVVKVAVIPIVTLVIGYYFAAEKAT